MNEWPARELLNRVQTIQHVQLILPLKAPNKRAGCLLATASSAFVKAPLVAVSSQSVALSVLEHPSNLNLDKVAEMLIEKVGIQLSGNRRQATEAASVKQLTNRQAWHLLIIKNVVDPSSLTGRILRRRTHKLVPSSSSFYTMFHFAVFL